MSNLKEVQNLLKEYQTVTLSVNQLENTIKSIDKWNEEEYKVIYRNEFYGDGGLQVYAINETLSGVNSLQERCRSGEDIPWEFIEGLEVSPDRFAGVDLEYCTLSYKVEEGVDFDEYPDFTTIITISGEVPFSKDKQEEERIKLRDQISDKMVKLKEIEEQLKMFNINV